MDEETEKRLLALETKASFQEAALADMSKLVVDQDIRISRLEAALRDLRDRIKELNGEGQQPLPDGERPPHY